MAAIRVTHLLDGRHFGGAEQMVRRLVAASPGIGVEADVFCLAEGRLAEYLRGEEIAVRIFPSSGRFDVRPLGDMTQALRESGTQIIQAHTSRTHLFARLISHRTGIANITTIHSPIALDENRGGGSHQVRALVERLGRRWTDAICCVSSEEAARLVKEEGASRRKVVHVPNFLEDPNPEGVDGNRRAALEAWLAERGEAADAFVVAMVAALRPRKGAAVLIEAFARYIEAGKSGVLVIVGDDEFTGAGGGHVAELKTLCGELGIAERVAFLGFREEPWALAGGADLVALPSMFGEGLPLVLIEAMARGLSIAASDTAGNRECVESGATGWLHPAGDAEALAKNLKEAAEDRDRLRAMGDAGRDKFLQNYASDVVLEKWREVYERVAALT